MSLCSIGRIVRRRCTDCRRRQPRRQHPAPGGWCEATALRLVVLLLLAAATIAPIRCGVEAFGVVTTSTAPTANKGIGTLLDTIGPSGSGRGTRPFRTAPPPSPTSRRYAAAAAAAAALAGSSDGGPNNVVVSLPAHGVKVGALRFLLQLYLVGQQNHPVPNSWLTQANDNNGDLDVYYGDGTAALHIYLDESGIEFARRGEKPSLQYVLQESVLLHGILDEIENAALGRAGDDSDDDNTIDESKRLLRLSDPNDIDGARSKLPARKAS